MPAAGSYFNFHHVLIGVHHVWWTRLEWLLLEMEAQGVQVGVGEHEFPWRVVWSQRLEKEAPMKRFLVGKTLPIAPITTQTTAPANDQLAFPMLPTPQPPPPPPTIPTAPTAPTGNPVALRSGYQLKAEDPRTGTRRPDRQRGCRHARIFPSYHHHDDDHHHHHHHHRNRCPCKRMLPTAFARRQRLR